MARRVVSLIAMWATGAAACSRASDDVPNRHPVRLVRPVLAPLSAVASIGRAIFSDSTLSSSGHVSCASCHQPDRAYAGGAPSAARVATGEAVSIGRAVPSLRYVYRTPPFSIGPASIDVDDTVSRVRVPPPSPGRVKNAGAVSSDALVPRGGLFWDGRVNTLQDQAMGPLFNPAEMGNRDVNAASERLRRAPYSAQLATLFGAAVLTDPARLVDEAMFAVARYQIEDPSFHPYTSKYDLFLEGKDTLTASEWRGLRAFDDTARGNCAACHVDRPRGDGLPPMFTDYEYEALGVPRPLTSITEDRPDLGICGPVRTDLRAAARYCGMFRTPSLRNVGTRSAFFHNGVYRTLEQVLAFYNWRDIRPEKIYPNSAASSVEKFNDLPPRYRGNVDTVDAPFNRRAGNRPPLNDQDIRDIIAFLKTLTDGYRPESRTP